MEFCEHRGYRFIDVSDQFSVDVGERCAEMRLNHSTAIDWSGVEFAIRDWLVHHPEPIIVDGYSFVSLQSIPEGISFLKEVSEV